MTTALTVSNNLTFTPTGLDIYCPDDATIEEWLQVGSDFRRHSNTRNAIEGLSWGAWLNFGKRKFGEAYTQGWDYVLPPDPNDIRSRYAEKTIWQYEYTAEHVPLYLWGLPGVSHRHYFDAITRLNDPTEHEPATRLAEHLVKVSQERWSVRVAAQQLPSSTRKQLPPPDTGYPDDLNHLLTVENHHLQHELDAHRALIDEASANITQARDILAHVVGELPVEQAEQVNRALGYLRPVVVRSEFVELVGQAIDLYDRGEIGAMVVIMDRLRELRQEMLSARADDTITVNGRVEQRGEWLESQL